jgi:tetratricopeptide (TPR) repeat protein
MKAISVVSVMFIMALILISFLSSCSHQTSRPIEREEDENSVKLYGLSHKDIEEFYKTHPEYAQRYLYAPPGYPVISYAGEFGKLRLHSDPNKYRPIHGYGRGVKILRDTSKVGHIRIRFDMAMDYYNQGKLDEAAELFKAIIPLKPDSATVYYNLGIISVKKGMYREAIEYFDKAIEKARSGEMMIDAYLNSALCYMRIKKLKKAEAQLLEAVKLDPNDPGVRYNLGIVYLREEEPEKALKEFERCLPSKELQPEARMGMGLSYARMNDREKAIEQFRLAAQLRDDGQVWYNIGVLSFDLGRYDQAKEAFNKAIERGYPEAKISGFLRAIGRMRRRNAKVAYNEGVTLQRTAKYKEAISAFRKALELDPKLEEAYLNMAFCLGKIRRVNEAAETLREVLRINPNFVEARYNLGTLYLRMSRYADAAEELTKVVQARPYMAEARHNLGMALYRMNRFSEAEREFEEVLRMRPKWDEAHYNLGLTYLRLGKQDKALSEFQETLNINPSHLKAKEALESIVGAH